MTSTTENTAAQNTKNNTTNSARTFNPIAVKTQQAIAPDAFSIISGNARFQVCLIAVSVANTPRPAALKIARAKNSYISPAPSAVLPATKKMAGCTFAQMPCICVIASAKRFAPIP